MTCKYCEMRERMSGKLKFMQGESYTSEAYGPNVKATIEHDKSFGYLLFIEDYYEYDDETHITSILIRCCPWCGEKLQKEVRDD